MALNFDLKSMYIILHILTESKFYIDENQLLSKIYHFPFIWRYSV